MKIYLKTFLIQGGILAALLFWGKPATDLISVDPVDWKQEYEDEYVKPKYTFGAMAMAKELIRESRPTPTLEEFIQKETEGYVVEGNPAEWKAWIDKRASEDGFDKFSALFVNASDPIVSGVSIPFGFIELKGKQSSSYIRFNKLEPDELGGKNIPSNQHYPNRSIAIILFVFVGLLITISKFQAKTKDLLEKSTPVKGVKVFIGFLNAGLALVILPFFYGWFHNSPPFIFGGGFVVIVGIVGIFMFGWQVGFTRRLLNGENLLAHWTLEGEQWWDKVAKEYQLEKEMKQTMFYFITVIIILVGGGFSLFVEDFPAGIMSLVFLGIIALLGFLSFISPKINYDRKMKMTGEIFISPEGLYLCGAVHTWRLAGARLESVVQKEKPFSMIEVTYSYLMMAGRMWFAYRNNATVRVPIPQGKEEEAKGIVERLS